MALTIDKVHDRLDYLIKKNRWGYTSPEQKDICLDMAQTDLFNEYYGNPNQYKYGRPIPPVAHGQTQKLHDALIRLLWKLSLDGAGGFTALPSDYVHLDSAFIVSTHTTWFCSVDANNEVTLDFTDVPNDTNPTGDGDFTGEFGVGDVIHISQSSNNVYPKILTEPIYNASSDITSFTISYIDPSIDWDAIKVLSRVTTTPLKLVSNDKVAFKDNSQLMSVKNPDDFSYAFISLTTDNTDQGIQLHPKAVPPKGTATAYYLKRPAIPVFGYTQSGRTITYASGSSTQLEWQDDEIEKIIQKAIQYIGMGLEDQTLFQAGQIKDNE